MPCICRGYENVCLLKYNIASRSVFLIYFECLPDVLCSIVVHDINIRGGGTDDVRFYGEAVSTQDSESCDPG